jgi:hypothetical protein
LTWIIWYCSGSGHCYYQGKTIAKRSPESRVCSLKSWWCTEIGLTPGDCLTFVEDKSNLPDETYHPLRRLFHRLQQWRKVVDKAAKHKNEARCVRASLHKVLPSMIRDRRREAQRAAKERSRAVSIAGRQNEEAKTIYLYLVPRSLRESMAD